MLVGGLSMNLAPSLPQDGLHLNQTVSTHSPLLLLLLLLSGFSRVRLCATP